LVLWFFYWAKIRQKMAFFAQMTASFRKHRLQHCFYRNNAILSPKIGENRRKVWSKHRPPGFRF
jgi:hypothetical protein